MAHAVVAHAEIASQEGRTDFHLRLEPPELGTVQIHLTATDNNLVARVVVVHEATRQLIESQADSLRQTLAGVGVTLGGLDVRRDGGGSPGAWQQPQPEAPATPFAPGSPRPHLTASWTAPGRSPGSITTATDGIDVLA